MDSSYVNLVFSGDIAQIEFFHPKANVFSSSQLQKLKEAIDRASEQVFIKVIVIKSARLDIFSAGAFLDELTLIESLEEGIEFFMGFSRLIISMITSKKLILAKFSGKALAGAVGLLAACDYVIGDQGVLVRLSELSIGLAPLVIEPVIVHRIGRTHYLKLTLTPHQWQGAEWCEKVGLLSHIVNKQESLTNALGEYTRFLMTCDSFSIAKVKSIFYGDISNWRRLLQNRARLSAELLLRSGVQRNLSCKQKPL